AKPNFINEVKQKGIDVITRVANSNKIWQFADKCKTLESLYVQANKTKASKLGNYNLQKTGTFEHSFRKHLNSVYTFI
ncbi:hypothetical protein, partial [Aliarcobacter butzleri]